MKHKVLRIRIRILVLTLPLFLSISGCATTNNTQSNQEVIKTSSSAKQADPPEVSILTDSERRNYVFRNCNSGIVESRSHYGNWFKAKSCSIKIDRTKPSLKITAIHLDDKGDITGIKMITLDSDTATYLYSKYNVPATAPSDESCIKMGENSFPFLVVVKKELCTALEYGQV